MKSFKIITFGCKVNTYESEFMKENLLNSGFFMSETPNIYIINTCSVTNAADTKSKKAMRKVKRDNPHAILVVCGCMAEHLKEELIKEDIDILIGNKDKSKIGDILNNYLKTKEKYIHFIPNKNLEFERMQISKFTNQTRAFIKIQDGCDSYCSYCIIPKLRGNIRSKDFNDAVTEISGLVNNNHKEIVLTGIHTGKFGKGLNYELADLIEVVSKNEDLKRIRISSIEITELTELFFDLLKNNPKICNHLHIPLQSGSDSILKAMNRKYNTAGYEKIINKIRTIRPDISITTDVIVGFPSETDEYFKETINFCEKIKFSKIHVFPYSLRSGTKAALMNNQIPSEIKKKRAKELNALSIKLERDYYLRFLNKEVEVLIETVKEKVSIGHTSNYLKVHINKKLKANELVNVKITKVSKNIAYGEKI